MTGKLNCALQATPLALPGIFVLQPKTHGDDRGMFSEIYNKQAFENIGLSADFVQDNHSLSVHMGTIRGLHFQIPPFAQVKLVWVPHGAIFDICVDIRHGSPTFGQHVGVHLDAQNRQQLWVPEGFAHGFCTLEPDTQVLYKVSNPFAPAYDKGLTWDDPDLAIDWPLDQGITAVLSDKDRTWPPLSALPTYFDHGPDTP